VLSSGQCGFSISTGRDVERSSSGCAAFCTHIFRAAHRIACTAVDADLDADLDANFDG
jgi:hypothetical protein